MLQIKTIIFVLGISLLLCGSIYSQANTFSDPNVEYSFMLPEVGWKMIAKPSTTSPNVEYVFNDRREAHLTIRKVPIEKRSFLSDVIRDEEQKLQFQPGFVAGKEENFAGNLKGTVFNYEFLSGGRNMSGRIYFLRSGDTTVYMLRFTGERDRLKSLRNQTDSIARTFDVKAAG